METTWKTALAPDWKTCRLEVRREWDATTTHTTRLPRRRQERTIRTTTTDGRTTTTEGDGVEAAADRLRDVLLLLPLLVADRLRDVPLLLPLLVVAEVSGASTSTDPIYQDAAYLLHVVAIDRHLDAAATGMAVVVDHHHRGDGKTNRRSSSRGKTGTGHSFRNNAIHHQVKLSSLGDKKSFIFSCYFD